jgi:hypothetical protein
MTREFRRPDVCAVSDLIPATSAVSSRLLMRSATLSISSIAPRPRLPLLTFESCITAKNSVLRPSENKMPLLSRDLPLPLGADAVEEHALLRIHYLCGTYGGRRLGASGPDVRSKVSVVNSPSFADTCFRLLRCLRRCARARGAGS